jgi:hypothetical protein
LPTYCAPSPAVATITDTKTLAWGVFAAGHLGELTQQVPFEMVDAVLAETGTVQSRVRALPSRVVVDLLLAAWLFADLGYVQVWHRLVAGLDSMQLPSPTAEALTKARRRVGGKPLQALFDLLRGPAATTAAGVRWRGLLVCAIDGTTMSVADTPANLGVFTKQAGHHGGSGYPLLRMLALVACGTRTLIDAAFGPTPTGELGYARQLLPSLRTGMIVLLDRNFDTAALLQAIAATKAQLLVRLKRNRKLPVLGRYPDGSYLSQIGATPLCVVQAELTIATSAGRRTEVYRLATTLLDHHRYPAFGLVTLYHQRWEIETAYLELKSTILGGGVLRARTPTASPRRSTPCWSATSSCGWPWPTPPPPNPMSTPTGPASPSRSTPPATSSSRPPVSSPRPLSTWSARSAGRCWTTCWPTAACGSAPGSSSGPSPTTTPEVPGSTGPATKQPSASTSLTSAPP